MKKAVLYICYYDINEPLVQTQVVAYLRELARQYEIHLLTFERDRLSAQTERATRKDLANSGIRWHALRYHQHPSLLATLYDIAVGTVKAAHICRKYKITLVHARSYVPAAMAIILKRLTGCRFLFDVRGLLADEYLDARHWAASDIKYKLTKRMERAFFRRADALVVLTNRILADLVQNESALLSRVNDITVIPCCVDTSKFIVSPDQRRACRLERGWTDRVVLTYVGKLGTWYLADEMARFFAVAREVIPNLFFQVLTQSDPSPIEQALRANAVPASDYSISFAAPVDLPLVLVASDAGISFIRACYSKRSSSPTKIGEYLAAGLPVVGNSGIGDCDHLLGRNRLGPILSRFSEDEYLRAARELLSALRDEEVTHRSRSVAERELSLSNVGGPRYASVYHSLIGAKAVAPVSRATEIGVP